MRLSDQIKQNEGFSAEVYTCPAGYATVGYGFRVSDLTDDELALNDNKPAPMRAEVADKVLELKIEKLHKRLSKDFKWFEAKSENVQSMLIEIAFQLGVSGLKKFKKMLSLIEKGEHKLAYNEGLDSLWAKQTPSRAKKVLGALL